MVWNASQPGPQCVGGWGVGVRWNENNTLPFQLSHPFFFWFFFFAHPACNFTARRGVTGISPRQYVGNVSPNVWPANVCCGKWIRIRVWLILGEGKKKTILCSPDSQMRFAWQGVCRLPQRKPCTCTTAPIESRPGVQPSVLWLGSLVIDPTTRLETMY